MSVEDNPIRITSKPREVTPSAKAVANSSEDGRISWPITTVALSRSISKKAAKATPTEKVKSAVISLSTKPRMS